MQITPRIARLITTWSNTGRSAACCRSCSAALNLGLFPGRASIQHHAGRRERRWRAGGWQVPLLDPKNTGTPACIYYLVRPNRCTRSFSGTHRAAPRCFRCTLVYVAWGSIVYGLGAMPWDESRPRQGYTHPICTWQQPHHGPCRTAIWGNPRETSKLERTSAPRSCLERRRDRRM
jgi:hypothetical protein